MRACCLCTRPQLLLAYPSPLVQPREKRDDNLWYQIYPLKEKKYTMDHVISTFFVLLNPLTPDSTVTGHNDRWALFHFWHHHLWPKLASLILKVRRRKSPFLIILRLEWFGQLNLNIHENGQKFEKTRTKLLVPQPLSRKFFNHCSKRKVIFIFCAFSIKKGIKWCRRVERKACLML